MTMTYKVYAILQRHDGHGVFPKFIYGSIYREDAEARLEELAKEMAEKGYLLIDNQAFLFHTIHSFELREEEVRP